ncbi:YceI family protein [Brumimicrobium oceani]|uniref:Lipid/polyisoprenoid-binding YceI-like domain-containing protein n=1 Tax=Brumimicrobium oceani TaxID=2100725 RepID=A0A2U2XCP6_9FLAO|nr:YceI family protein [Brumimicrobium oceani]PWH85481.1 hypothetical protein DIT68_09500 [Brumimicrobium oceani]
MTKVSALSIAHYTVLNSICFSEIGLLFFKGCNPCSSICKIYSFLPIFIENTRDMVKNTKFLFAALAGLMISSCAGNTEEAETAEVVTEQEEKCVYSYSNEGTVLNFTAFKFLSKAGVGGSFTEINVSGGQENESAVQLIENLSFEIPISSIATKDKGRDAKIQEYFFGSINTEMLSGEVLKLNAENSVATLSIKMNGVTKNVNGDYTLDEGGKFTFNSEINVNDWEAQKGIEALNEECKDLHTDYANGDTESKLWPDVALSFEMKLKKDCK